MNVKELKMVVKKSFEQEGQKVLAIKTTVKDDSRDDVIRLSVVYGDFVLRTVTISFVWSMLHKVEGDINLSVLDKIRDNLK